MGLFSSFFAASNNAPQHNGLDSRKDVHHFYGDTHLDRFSLNNSFAIRKDQNTIVFTVLLRFKDMRKDVNYLEEIYNVNYDKKTVLCTSCFVNFKNGSRQPTSPAIKEAVYASPQSQMECIYLEGICGYIASHGESGIDNVRIYDTKAKDGWQWQYRILPAHCCFGESNEKGQGTIEATVSASGDNGASFLATLSRYVICTDSQLVTEVAKWELKGDKRIRTESSSLPTRATNGSSLEYAILVYSDKIYQAINEFELP